MDSGRAVHPGSATHQSPVAPATWKSTCIRACGDSVEAEIRPGHGFPRAPSVLVPRSWDVGSSAVSQSLLSADRGHRAHALCSRSRAALALRLLCVTQGCLAEVAQNGGSRPPEVGKLRPLRCFRPAAWARRWCRRWKGAAPIGVCAVHRCFWATRPEVMLPFTENFSLPLS